MATEVRQGVAEQQVREVGPGGEEVYEIEKGVRVRKSGGVEFAPAMSSAEIDARHSELTSQIEYQKAIIHRAREEATNAARQANEQEILAREAVELREFNRSRQMEAAAEAKSLMVEVTALIEKEKELERQRAATHHAAVEKERERVQAKTAEIIAREEAIEAEKREQYYNEQIRKCQALTLRYKLEEEQAKLKLESLQFNLQHGEFRPQTSANRAKIVVEVEPRELPEARQFDTSQVEVGIASATFGQEGTATIADTRSIEEIVMAERKHKVSTVSSSSNLPRGAEESFGREEFKSTTSAPSSILPSSQTGDIKVLSDIKPSSSHEQAYAGGAAQQPGQLMSSSGEIAKGAAAPQTSEATATITEKKKQKGGGFFKKFTGGKSHEQH